jgi:hypothetical protein
MSSAAAVVIARLEKKPSREFYTIYCDFYDSTRNLQAWVGKNADMPPLHSPLMQYDNAVHEP